MPKRKGLTLFVRGGMAWPFLLVIGLLLLGISVFGSLTVAQITALVLASELSVLTYSRSDWFWGIFIGLLSALLIGWEIKSFLRATRELDTASD